MTPLYEKYRPRTLDDVVGQPKAVALTRRLLDRSGAGGNCFWISGPSGTGKTTLARIIASTIADEFAVAEYKSGAQLTMGVCNDIDQGMWSYGFGRGGRAYIINESHQLRSDAVPMLLGMTEPPPPHVCFIFTTTKAGEESFLFDGIDSMPLLSRCKRITLTNQGLAQAFAERVQTIQRAEGWRVDDLGALVKLAQRHKNNMRAMLQEAEDAELAEVAA
jgi:DNA polymerase III gamma/tau subunit